MIMVLYQFIKDFDRAFGFLSVRGGIFFFKSTNSVSK